MRLRSLVLLLTLSSACSGGGFYQVQRRYFDGERLRDARVPAVRESDRAAVVLRSDSLRIDEPIGASAVRVRGLGTRNPIFKVGAGAVVLGVALTVVGAAIVGYGLGHQTCNPYQSNACGDNTGLVSPGLGVGIAGLAVGLVVGPVVMAVGAQQPPREVYP